MSAALQAPSGRNIAVLIRRLVSGPAVFGTFLVWCGSFSGGMQAQDQQGAEIRIQGVPVEGVTSAVVSFDEVATRESLNPLVSEPIPMTAPAPRRLEESSLGPTELEPPTPAAADVPGVSGPSPSPSNNYDGEIDQAEAGGGGYVIPPDTMGAVGSDSVNKVFVTLNNNYKIQDKATGAQISLVSMPAFWAAVGATSPFDPRVQYDPYNNRWILAAATESQSATTSILVGISQTSDPSGAYYLFKFPARLAGDPATVNLADFPMLGFNKNWVVVSINMFSTTAFVDGRVLVINYPTLRTGEFSATYFPGLSASVGGFSLHPATSYSATEDTEYLVAHLSSGSAQYKLDTITGTSAAPVLTIGPTKTRPGGAWSAPGGNLLPQATGTCSSGPMKIDVGDAFVRTNVVFRNDSIWYAQTVGLPAGGMTHTAAQWTQLNTAGDVVQGGRVEDPSATASNGGKWYAYPSIAANAHNDVLVGFSQMSSAQFASAGYAYHHHTDATGSMRDPVISKAGEDCYSKDFGSGENRWGDYSHTLVDPTGDLNFWTIQEYARLQASPIIGGSTSKWGTRWTKVNPPGSAPFTDDPLSAGTLIKAVHITELRSRIDAIRAARGLPAFSYGDPTLTVGSTVVRAVHITDLRTALSQAYVAAGSTPPTYTDPSLAAGVPVKVAHIAELRAAIVAIE
jgi:hypothetical protein